MSYIGNTKIGKMYLGNTEIAKAYLGNNLVFQKGGDAPTIIPYLRNTSSAYIDTGITPDQTTKIIVWARNWNPGGASYTWLFGSRVANQNSMFGASLMSNANTGKIRACFGDVNKDIDNKWTLMSHYHKYELSADGFYVDDILISEVTAATFSNNHNIYLFNCNNAGSPLTTSAPPTDICACKIYKNGVLVRDYTPTNSPFTGLHDAVSETVFQNAGTGSLSYGSFNPDAYKPLEYISANGTSYFMTDAIGGYSLKAITKFKPTGTTATYSVIFGSRDATNRCQFFVGNESYSSSCLSAILGTGSATDFYAANPKQEGFVRNKEIVALKSNNTLSAYIDNTQVGNTYTSSVNSSYTTNVPICVCADWYIHNSTITHKFYGKMYYIRLNNYNYVPAKVGGVAGMYDTYNDVFKPSASDTAFSAGPELKVVATNYFSGKKLSIIGDSISTYNQDGYKYDSYRMYYPAGDVSNVNVTWWKRLINDEGAVLEVNLAYSASRVTTHPSSYPTLYDRASLIGNADIVIIAMGTNDSSNSVPLGNYSYDTPVGDLDVSYFRDAYIKGIKGILATNPNVEIVCAIFSMDDDYRNSIKEIANHYGFMCLDCGNDYQKYQTVHPDEYGMREIEKVFLLAQ